MTREPRRTYSSPRQEARQRRILETARTEISRVGYDAITMQALADAAGVSTKTLYNLYGTRDELLLAAVADLLVNLEQQDTVLRAEPGIPRLLAFTDSVSAQIVRNPRYAEVMAQSLFRAPAGHNLVDVLPGNTLRFTARALEAEREAGGFRDPVDVPALSEILSGCQWGLVLMWSKGLVALEDMRRRSRRSQLLALLPLCTEARRRQLEREWTE